MPHRLELQVNLPVGTHGLYVGGEPVSRMNILENLFLIRQTLILVVNDYFESQICLLPDEGIYGIARDAKQQPTIRYNLSGQRIAGNYRGLVVTNGKKLIVK